ncbi:MAG TPA: SpvB/TcaC N-terminal domain-containing protein, partial [Myxococcota bacterium]|nr:SpvB/TcaC N-terminal domain-containing protein [Myxococcota bacterium]
MGGARCIRVAAATLLALVASFEPAQPARAANDPKDLESQNATEGRVVQSTGQAHLRIEIEAPKGTAGSEPELALSYASHLADGPFGVGWRLELGEIRRSDRFGTPAYDDTADRFELDGALLVAHPDAAGHAGEFRTLEESFARIRRVGEGWLVEYPNGRKARFGTSQETRVRRDGSTDFERDAGPIGRWLLAELEDAHGNVVRFRYAREIDVGTAYPRAVEYSYRAESNA